ncbi:hypothetical protein BH18CHL2_BH18CHL2_06770 [soil metagenome]
MGDVQKAKDLAITLEDRPGTFAKAAEAIAKAGINIEGFCAVEEGGRGTLHVLTTDDAGTRRALESQGFKVSETKDVFIVKAEDRPGFLANILRKVADQEINVGLSYTATNSRIVMSAENAEQLRQVLEEVSRTAGSRN